MNVTEPIRQYASATPSAPAFIKSSGEVVSYAAFERVIDAVAARAVLFGLGPGQCAALSLPNLYQQIVVALALARIGVAHGPPGLPAGLVTVAVIDATTAPAEGVRTLAVDDLWAEPAGDVAPMAVQPGGALPWMYCATSGTAGTARFVPISHDVSLRRARARASTAAAVGGGRGLAATRLASFVGPRTSYGFSSALLVLHGGGAVVQPTVVVHEMRDWFARSGVNYLITSPIAITKVLHALPGPITNTLETIEVGGGALSRAVYDEACARLCANILMGYGLTECGRVASAPMHEVQARMGGVGYALPGVELRVVDEQGEMLPPGREGVLCVRSDSAAAGYLDAPAAQAEVFQGDWVRSGDRAILEADGYLRILGRTDDVINFGGVRVQPQAIEAELLALGDVQEAAVFGVERGAAPAVLCAAVVPSAGLDAEAYHRRCRDKLGAWAPTVIMHLPRLPRNDMGKVQRAELVAAVIHHKGWKASAG